MGMTKAVQVAIELHRLGLLKFTDSIIDMGSQELHLKYDEFEYYMKAGGICFDEKDFLNLRNYPGGPRQSTKPFWKSLGYENIKCMDINRKHDSIYCDLNKPFENTEEFGRYDLVTDFGNNEHAFNIAEAYNTMHKLCKKDGCMWIDQAIMNGNGFYNFDIAFFECLAAANNYKIVYNALVVNALDGEQYHMPCTKKLLRLFDISKVKDLGISYIFRKTSSLDFVYPYQNFIKGKERGPFEISFSHERYHSERHYIPMKVSGLSGKQLIDELRKRLFSRLKSSFRQ